MEPTFPILIIAFSLLGAATIKITKSERKIEKLEKRIEALERNK